MDIPSLIVEIGNTLKRLKSVTSVITVPDAIVPIVKFMMEHEGVRLEGDISFNKVLARRNTQLIKTYSSLDDRFLKLGFVLKGMYINQVQNASVKSLAINLHLYRVSSLAKHLSHRDVQQGI